MHRSLNSGVIHRFLAPVTLLVLVATGAAAESRVESIQGPLRGPYLGQTAPGTTPELFAPGILSTALHDDGPAHFNADGTELWYRKYAVPHDIVGTMRLVDGVWTQPELFKPMGKWVVSPPNFAADGKAAYFGSRCPLDGGSEAADYNIWIAHRVGDGWSELTPLPGEVNTPEHEYVSSVSAKGNLYLQGRGEDTLGSYDLYISEMVDGLHRAAVNLGAPLNTEHMDAAPAVAADESYLVFCRYGDDDTVGETDLYVSFRQADRSWGAGINLGPEVNSGLDDKFPALTPDGRFIFFVSHRGSARGYVYSDMSYEEAMQRNLGPYNGRGSVYWVSTEVIEKLRP